MLKHIAIAPRPKRGCIDYAYLPRAKAKKLKLFVDYNGIIDKLPDE